MWAWNVGKIRGIPLRVHLTFPLAFLWAAWEWGRGGSWRDALYGVLVMTLIFVCVLLHELGHSFVARWRGIRVREILLLPLGGVAYFDDALDRPLDELLIAVAGPLVNGVIVFLLAWPTLISFRRLTSMGRLQMLAEPSVRGMLLLLLLANLLLALFNLLPIFPMDGGRIVRALLAMILPYEQATWLAVRGGQLFAILMAVYGFWANLWFLVLGLFVFTMAQGELTRLARLERLKRARVGDYMVERGLSLRPEMPIAMAWQLSLTTPQQVWPIVAQERLVGLVSRRRLERARRRVGTLRDIMVTEYPILDIDDSLYDAYRRLQHNLELAAAVLEDGIFVGTISHYEVAIAWQQRSEKQRISHSP